jgi:hypothetical protein
MDKFPNANLGFSSQNIINYTRVEPYNIYNEYIVNSLFLIQPILMLKIKSYLPINSIHYFKKRIMNSLYLLMSCTEKKQNPNEPIHLFITRGASIGKTFTLMFLIQALICFFK